MDNKNSGTVQESEVSRVIKSLSSLEDDLDSLNSGISDIKNKMNIKTQDEINKLVDTIRQIATNQANQIINEAKTRANSQSSQINKDGDAKLAEIKNKIDTNFDDAVKYTVSTILNI